MEFTKGLKYPWGEPRRLWNILWVLVPIIGWFALGGYIKKIVNSIVKGNTKKLPAFGSFEDNLAKGFMLIVKSIPLTIAVIVVGLIPFIGPIITWTFSIFLAPWIGINLLQKYTIESTFEFKKAGIIVFNHLGEYLLALVKTIVFSVIYFVLSIVLVGIPCLSFGREIYFAEFYAKYSKKAKK